MTLSGSTASERQFRGRLLFRLLRLLSFLRVPVANADSRKSLAPGCDHDAYGCAVRQRFGRSGCDVSRALMASGKNPKHNARTRLYRARVRLAEALQRMEDAIGVVLEQPGPIYKRGEAEHLLEDVRAMRATHDLGRHIRPAEEPPPAVRSQTHARFRKAAE